MGCHQIEGQFCWPPFQEVEAQARGTLGNSDLGDLPVASTWKSQQAGVPVSRVGPACSCQQSRAQEPGPQPPLLASSPSPASLTSANV